ncbi:MAG TPA: PLP-dependent aminotransferase family protein [Solirubrobacteraceae bacterium]|nr:PLP-dependent aminotransferase family protein [Solirubrobacteraceae bacterium]
MDLQIDLVSGSPLRLQLEEALRDAIRSGRLLAGTLLPPSRVLAQELGMSRGVVVDSYSQLVAEGYLTAKRGSGTRVATLPAPWVLPGAREPRHLTPFRYDLRPGQADFHAFPRRRWQAALTRALRELPDTRLTYAPHRGAPELRIAVAAYLRRARAVVAEADQVVISCGVSHGLLAVLAALRRRGARRVAIEDPGWRWQRRTVVRVGLEAVPVRVDEHGLIVSDLAAQEADAVMVTAAHQYPTGVVLSPERRDALIAWARERNAVILEDDYDAEYRYDRDPVPALQSVAPDRVAYVGTVSKTLAPALRIGWIVAPARLLGDIEQEFRVSAAQPPTIDQVALAGLVEDGGLDRHLRAMRRRYRAKRELLIDTLAQHAPALRLSGAAAGLHVMAWLPAGCDEHAVALRAGELSVGVHELHRNCMAEGGWPAALLLGYALPTEAEISTGAQLLAQAIG